MSPSLQQTIDQATQALREQLQGNLYSCCLYGSAVRGNFIEGQSDINLLIILGVSDPAAHDAIARAIGKNTLIDPFVIGRQALAGSVRAFGTKFASIKRNYRILVGADPLADLVTDLAQERFLCEQALRNLQLRMTYAFVTRQRGKPYRRFLIHSVTPLFIQFSEVLRLENVALPKDFAARIAVFEPHFQVKGDILRELLALKTGDARPQDLSDEEWHQQLFPVVDAVIAWIGNKWHTR
ncbi:MAG TPA: nucleotidyltransferase domain-containing protein [Candidatus Limnocylindrales bacterium]|nr:nucleotidyltransferase domain-containing protein [Candidatus Limnocylindrales bacterium]